MGNDGKRGDERMWLLICNSWRRRAILENYTWQIFLHVTRDLGYFKRLIIAVDDN